MILINTENGLLNLLFKKPLIIWQAYIRNLNNVFVWLTLPFLLLGTCIYLIFLPFYAIFTLLSFAQNFDDYNGWLIIIKIILYLPSVAFIMFAYYPAIVIGSIMSIVMYPCDLVYKKKLVLPPLITDLINATVNEVIQDMLDNKNNNNL